MKTGRLVVLVLLGVLGLLSFLWYRSVFLNSFRNEFQNHHWSNKNENSLNLTTQLPNKTDLQMNIDAMFDRIEKLIPIAPFTHFNRTTSGKRSKAFIANPKEQYCVGEELVVQIDMFDHSGNRKRHGGDFIRARLFSSGLGASVSGQVEDLNNGSYHVRFNLYWAGNAKVSIWLFHPSEGVAALWRARHASQGVLGFEGKFEMSGKHAVTKCAFKLYEEEGKEICEYLDPLYEEAFYCFKAPNFPCESLNEMRGYDLEIPHITPDESKLFERSNIAVDIPQTFDSISVNACRVVEETPKPKCQTGMGSPLPSGYFYNNIWQPVYCSMTVYNTGEDFLKCLERKKLFLYRRFNIAPVHHALYRRPQNHKIFLLPLVRMGWLAFGPGSHEHGKGHLRLLQETRLPPGTSKLLLLQGRHVHQPPDRPARWRKGHHICYNLGTAL